MASLLARLAGCARTWNLVALLSSVLAIPAPAHAANPTYAQPPRCLVWLEGEDCDDHNWREGPVDNCWAFGWAGVHGGVLDLASWRLPGVGECFFARFPFEVP